MSKRRISESRDHIRSKDLRDHSSDDREAEGRGSVKSKQITVLSMMGMYKSSSEMRFFIVAGKVSAADTFFSTYSRQLLERIN